MQLGMIGLGRMGGNMVRRLMRGGHQCVVFDLNPDNVKGLAGEGATGRKLHGGVRQEADQAARGLGHGAGGRSHGKHRDEAGRLDGAGRHDYRRRQFVFQGRYPPGENPQGARPALSGRRHQRRSLGHRARLLHDDWRIEGIGDAPGSDLQDAGSGSGRRRPDYGTRRQEKYGRERIFILRSLGRRPLREDGPQRHRIRPDASLRGRLRHHAQRHLEGIAGRSALQFRSGRRRRIVAARQRGGFVAAGLDGHGAD